MFDYLIVGGGSAGCVLAARLTENPDITVALLEAGPADSSVFIQCPAGIALMAQTGQAAWGIDAVPQPGLNGRSGYQPRGKVLGGSSSINAMIYIRGHRSDYDQWAAQGNPGWSYDDLLPYFKRAENNERGADDFHGVGGPLNVMDLRNPNQFGPVFVRAAEQAGFSFNPDFNGAKLEGVGMYQVTQKDGERCSAAKAYLTPHLARALTCMSLPAPTPSAHPMTERKRAVGVRIRTGQSDQAAARHAGSAGMRRLLAIAPSADALGHWRARPFAGKRNCHRA